MTQAAALIRARRPIGGSLLRSGNLGGELGELACAVRIAELLHAGLWAHEGELDLLQPCAAEQRIGVHGRLQCIALLQLALRAREARLVIDD